MWRLASSATPPAQPPPIAAIAERSIPVGDTGKLAQSEGRLYYFGARGPRSETTIIHTNPRPHTTINPMPRLRLAALLRAGSRLSREKGVGVGVDVTVGEAVGGRAVLVGAGVRVGGRSVLVMVGVIVGVGAMRINSFCPAKMVG